MKSRTILAALFCIPLICSCHIRERMIGEAVDGLVGGLMDAMNQDGNGQGGQEQMELPALEGDDIIIFHTGYTVSYNAQAHIPEWVAYELTSEELAGDLDRDEIKFQMDPAYRGTQAMREDYSGSGWTRGHMACAGDFEWDIDAMEETFYLTNVCPQDEELNRGDWNYLEKQVRRWARQYGKVWVASGPIIGTGKYGTIGDNKVTVPDSFFKAVLIEKGGAYHSIAFVMGNDSRRYYLADCSVSVNELEEMTGLNFFPILPDSVEESVESRKDFNIWSIKER